MTRKLYIDDVIIRGKMQGESIGRQHYVSFEDAGMHHHLPGAHKRRALELSIKGCGRIYSSGGGNA